jgi:hypothetical protein
VLDDLRGEAAAGANRGGLMCESYHHGRADNGGGETSTVGEPEPTKRCVPSALCLSHAASFHTHRKGLVIVT